MCFEWKCGWVWVFGCTDGCFKKYKRMSGS